jgi:hypothetical protein
MPNKIVKFLPQVLILCLFVSCTTVKNLVPKKNRAFQERNFDSKLWIEGDAQTRGEMSEDLRWKKSVSDVSFIGSKTKPEILEVLGEPDRKTRGKCCGVGGTFEEEVWLYNLEVKDPDGSMLTVKQFQFYFTESGKPDEIRISLWDDKNPDYYPRIG